MVLLQDTELGIQTASVALSQGLLVALPTETVYGLAANALDAAAARKIFEVKGRPFIDPLIVHILNQEWIPQIAEWNPLAECLAQRFWPGPLTLVLPKTQAIPDIVCAGGPTVAIRMPSNTLFRSVLKTCNLPLAAPSANPFGYLSPTTAQHVLQSLGDRIPYILDGGACRFGVESTIIDLSTPTPKILRPGPIPHTELSQALDTPIAAYTPATAKGPLKAPGMLQQHYSPHTPLFLHAALPTPTNNTTARIFFQRPTNPQDRDFWLSEAGDPYEAAHNLFALLQRLDPMGFSNIWIEKAPETGIGIALNDRISRAAAKFAH